MSMRPARMSSVRLLSVACIALAACRGGSQESQESPGPPTAQVDLSRIGTCTCGLPLDDGGVTPWAPNQYIPVGADLCACPETDGSIIECIGFPVVGLRCADRDQIPSIVTCPLGTELSVYASIPPEVVCSRPLPPNTHP
jgi:hypothetical protein